MRQKVTSVWQREVQMILTRTSCARGGATSTSSISRGCPGALLTAAAQRSQFKGRCPYNYKQGSRRDGSAGRQVHTYLCI